MGNKPQKLLMKLFQLNKQKNIVIQRFMFNYEL